MKLEPELPEAQFHLGEVYYQRGRTGTVAGCYLVRHGLT